MVEIKTQISFDEFNGIVNMVMANVFQDDTYHHELKELSERIALLQAFAPEFDMSDCKDNNDYFAKVYSEEAKNIIRTIEGYDSDVVCSGIVWDIHETISSAIDHRLKMIEQSPLSLADYALSKLIGVITDKVSQIDTSAINTDTINTIADVYKNSDNKEFVGNMIDAFAEKGYLSKPNRQTRRKNIKNNKTEAKTSEK